MRPCVVPAAVILAATLGCMAFAHSDPLEVGARMAAEPVLVGVPAFLSAPVPGEPLAVGPTDTGPRRIRLPVAGIRLGESQPTVVLLGYEPAGPVGSGPGSANLEEWLVEVRAGFGDADCDRVYAHLISTYGETTAGPGKVWDGVFEHLAFSVETTGLLPGAGCHIEWVPKPPPETTGGQALNLSERRALWPLWWASASRILGGEDEAQVLAWLEAQPVDRPLRKRLVGELWSVGVLGR